MSLFIWSEYVTNDACDIDKAEGHFSVLKKYTKLDFQVTDKKKTLIRDKEGNKKTAPELIFNSAAKLMS